MKFQIRKAVIFTGLLLAGLTTLQSLAGVSSSEKPLQQLLIQSPHAPKIFRELQKRGFDVGHGPLRPNTIEVFTENPESLLKSIRLPITSSRIVPSMAYKNLRNFRRRKSSLRGAPEYFDHQQAMNFMKRLSQRHPQRARLVDLHKALKVPKTLEGHSIWALRIGPPTTHFTSPHPKVLIIGQHHARELMTHHAVLDSAADYLAQIQAGNPLAVATAKNTAVWFVPVVNPDGLQHVFSHDRMWRKNRKPNHDGTFGVDLNRNYSFHWGKCGSNSTDPGSQIYRGAKAFSEFETTAMHRLNKLLKAQFVISYHSHGNEVLYPYVCGKLAEQNIYYDIRDRLAQQLRYGKRFASSSGEDFEHHYALHGSIAFLLEIGTSFQPPFSTYQRTVLPTVKKVLPFLMKELEKPFLSIQVLNSQQGGQPLVGAQVFVKELPLLEGEIRETDNHGISRRRVPAGIYNVVVRYRGRNQTYRVQTQGGLETPKSLQF